MLRTLSFTALILAFSLLQGCIAVGVGRGSQPTIADELKALHEARDDGKITCEEYNMGIAALQTRPQPER